MIEASFNSRNGRAAAIDGAYQYDTGQRLRMHGLPSPQELAQRDDFLAGDVVTVQAQYGYAGDSQTESRLASYDEETGTWLAEIPDMYMTRSTAVRVYVYVGYGNSEDESRAKTCYEGTFTPTGRPAPGTQVTPGQANAWDALVAEINLALAAVGTATSNANAAAALAAEAADGAALEADKLGGMAVTATTREYGSGSTASITDDGARKTLTLGLERGPQGEKGDTGATGPQGPKGPAGVTFSLSGTVLTITTT